MEVGRNAKAFDCATCTIRHCDESGDIPGSKGRASWPVWELAGEQYYTCPLPAITPLSRELKRLHHHYEQGLLPFAGGVLDQPAGFMRAMEIIDSVPRGEKSHG